MIRQPQIIYRMLKVMPLDEKKILRIEFTPEQGMEHVEVSYQFTAGNTVDLGLEINGHVNGWSGGARDNFFISENTATPGYVRTAIVEGSWCVLLGLYRIRHPCEITVSISLFPKSRRWFVGDTHVHSVHSDGKLNVNELIARAEALHHDFLCFTDHNTISQNLEILGINSPLCLIPGMELTSERGHVNFTGVSQPVESFLPHFSEADIFERIAQARSNGARIGINHPFCLHCPWQNTFTNYDWLEIWNSQWDATTGNEEAFSYWYQQLCLGQKIPVVAGSDFHKNKGLIYANTHVLARSNERADLLEALAQGRSYLQSDQQTQLHQFTLGDAQMGETSHDRILNVSLTTHQDNSVLVYTRDNVFSLLNHHGNINQQVDCGNSPFALLRVNRGHMAQLITNPVYQEHSAR